MKTRLPLLSLLLAGLLLVAARSAAAKDEPLDFLHTMQEKGFADLAIEYLNDLKNDPDAPKEIMEVWDLEMSRSYKAAAADAYNEKERKRDEEQQKFYIDKFIKENPNRPEALAAAADLADEEAKTAVLELAQANVTADPKEKADLIEKARKTFNEVQPRFAAAVESMRKRLAALTAKASKKTREDLVEHILENRLNVIIVDFYLAMTYPDGASEHTSLLTKASKAFDDLFQETRGTWIGMNAHFWQGRVLQDLKNFSEAKAIYEEVLVADSDTVDATSTSAQADAIRSKQKTGFEEFFADVELHYLQCLKHSSVADYVNEAVKWRVSHKVTSEKTPSYQAVGLELAKTYVEQGVKTPPKAKYWDDLAMKILKDIIKVTSPSRLEAIKLRKQLKPGASDEESYEEYIADLNEALGGTKKDYAKAIELGEAALEHRPPKLDKKTIDEVRGIIAGCMFYEARQAYLKNNRDKANEMLAKLLAEPEKGYRDTPSAAPAAKFKLDILLYEFGQAPEKDEATKAAKAVLADKVVKTANGITALWPGKPEADFARLTLMRLALVDHKLKEADDLLKLINPKSEVYGTALQWMGGSYWRAYVEEKLKVKELEEKKSPVPTELTAKRDDERKKAMAIMRQARDQLNSLRAPNTRMSDALRSAELALAQMSVEGGDFKEGASLYGELVDDVKLSEKPEVNETTLKIFNGAVSTYLQVPDIDKAAAVTGMLLKLGPDDKAVNYSLMIFARKLEMERKSLVRKLEAATTTEANDLAAKRDSYAKLLGELLGSADPGIKSLSTREKLEPRDMVWIASTAGLLQLDDLAAGEAKKILAKCPDDPPFAAAVDKAIPLLQTLLVDIEARKGNYADAIVHVDELINKFPKALKPLQTKAEVLEKWARSKDPSKFDDAIGQWNLIRAKLQRVRPNPDGSKMPEFYDATYREAKCLKDVAKMESGDKGKQRATQGLQILQQVLMFDAKMNNPKKRNGQQYANYKKLSDELSELSGIDVSGKKSSETEKTGE